MPRLYSSNNSSSFQTRHNNLGSYLSSILLTTFRKSRQHPLCLFEHGRRSLRSVKPSSVLQEPFSSRSHSTTRSIYWGEAFACTGMSSSSSIQVHCVTFRFHRDFAHQICELGRSMPISPHSKLDLKSPFTYSNSPRFFTDPGPLKDLFYPISSIQSLHLNGQQTSKKYTWVQFQLNLSLRISSDLKCLGGGRILEEVWAAGRMTS
jgi:hypothetical protein